MTDEQLGLLIIEAIDAATDNGHLKYFDSSKHARIDVRVGYKDLGKALRLRGVKVEE